MATDAEQHTAEAAVAAAWRERCGERAGPLEQADVDAIAEAAFQTPGVKPTVELIRRIAGGGSPNAIHPKLDAWFRQGRQSGTPSPVPSELIALWARLQEVATESALAAMAPSRAELAEHQAALVAAQDQLASDQQALVNERATTERLVEALRTDFQGLQQRNDSLQTEAGRLAAELQQAISTLALRQDEIARVSAQWRLADAETGRLRAALTTVEADLTTEARAHSLVREQLGAAQEAIAALHATVSQVNDVSAQTQETLALRERELEAARQDAAAATARASELESALQLAQATAASDLYLRNHLAAELARERGALAKALDRQASATDAQVALEATLRAVTAERDRLHASLLRLAQPTPPAPPG
jgi:exonuclease SbcC